MKSLQYAPLIYLALVGCASPPSNYSGSRDAWDEMRSNVRELNAVERPVLADNAGLRELLEFARTNNPGLGAAFQNWRAALERVPQVMALPNPRLSFGAYLSEVETRVGPMQGRIGVSQPFPWFGKLELAGDVAFEASEAARQALEAARLALDEKVRNTWYEYAWVERAIQITEGNRELLTHWEGVARSRMQTGLGRHADVIRAQVELGKLEDRVQTLSDLRRPLAAALNAALNRPSTAPLPNPSFPEQVPVPADQERLLASLQESSPVLKAQRHHQRSAEHAVLLADKAFYPDLSIGVDYTLIGDALNPNMAGSGDDAVALSLGLDLPIWRDSYRAGSRRAEAQAKAAGLNYEQQLNQLTAELEMALYKFRDADRRIELYSGSLVPKGEESIQALNTAYQTGEGGFLDLIDAERVLLEFQLQAVRAVADRAKALATTERITGVQLNQDR